MEPDAAVEFAGRTALASLQGATSRGAVRRVNEDSHLARFPLAVVADGMGGHEHGERASRRVVGALAPLAGSGPVAADRIVAALTDVNRDLMAAAPPGTVSGTTVAGVALVTVEGSDAPHWMVFNVGDSRVYTWDGRRLTQISVDHSVVQELLDAGAVAPEEALVHPDRNVITRAIGADAELEIDVWLIPADGPVTFLVCSDGLTKELGDERVAELLATHRGDQPLADALVAAALDAGGSDNITAVVFDYEPTGPGAAATSPRGALVDDTRPRG